MRSGFFNSTIKESHNINSFIGTLGSQSWEEGTQEFALSTLDHEDLFIVPNDSLKRIKKYLNRPVKIYGEIREDDLGIKFLEVKKVKRIRQSRFNQLKKEKENSYDYSKHIHSSGQFISNLFGINSFKSAS